MKTPAKNHPAGFTLIEYIVALVVAAIVAAMVYTYFGSAFTQSGLPLVRLKQISNLQQVMENIFADYNRLNQINLRYTWRPNTAYPVNSVVLPTTNNGYYYRREVATGTGISSGTEPTAWPVSGTVTDGGVTWTTSGRVWQPGVSYAVNAIVVPSNKKNNGHYYKRIDAAGTGISGATEPASWPATNGGTVVDGGVTWTEVGTVLDRSNINLTDATLIDSLKYYLDNTPGRYDPGGTGYIIVAAQFIKFNNTGAEVNATGTEEKNLLKVTIKGNYSGETLTQLFTIR